MFILMTSLHSLARCHSFYPPCYTSQAGPNDESLYVHMLDVKTSCGFSATASALSIFRHTQVCVSQLRLWSVCAPVCYSDTCSALPLSSLALSLRLHTLVAYRNGSTQREASRCTHRHLYHHRRHGHTHALTHNWHQPAAPSQCHRHHPVWRDSSPAHI